MRKLLVIVPVICLVLVVAYGAASYWVGGLALKQHDHLVSEVNGSNYLEASTRSYERGLFKSRSVTTFTSSRLKDLEPVRFSIVSTVHHGPFVFLENPHLKLGLRPVLAVVRMRLAPGDSSEALKKVLETIPELESSEALTVLSFDGSAESFFDVPSFQKTFPDDKGGQVQVDWGGLTAKSKFDAPAGRIAGSCGAPSLQITGQDGMLRIKDIKGELNSNPGIKGISVGSTVFSIGSIEGADKDKASFNLTSFGIKAQSGVSGDAIDGSVLISFDKLNANGFAMGPFVLEFESRKLDAEVLSRLQKLVPELQKQAERKTRDAEEALQKQAVQVVTDLLAKSPEFEIKQLRVRTSKGDLSGRAKLAFSSAGLGPPGNILALLGGMDASAELQVSESLFMLIAENALRDNSAPKPEQAAKESADGLVKGLMAANILISENGSFKSRATYRHGALTVNGRKPDLSNLQ
jgi:uncharacterized protein YdgA (DUF945 family)